LKTQILLPHQRIIFPLDFTSFEEAKKYVKELKDHVGLFKVGWTLYFYEGFKVIEKIQQITQSEKKIFFDFKFSSATVNDIPFQQDGVSSVIASGSKNLEFLTVHTMEGQETVNKVVRNFKTNGIKILGVTVLTSRGKEDWPMKDGFTSIEKKVLELSHVAKNVGCNGIVCSGLEAPSVRNEFGSEFIIVTPGIRPSWSKIKDDDQRRIVTPGEAIKNGADYIVVGRPIATAEDRVGAAQKIADEIQEAQEAIEK
jgi:orotidine-5'-phosphate decarboxylase